MKKAGVIVSIFMVVGMYFWLAIYFVADYRAAKTAYQDIPAYIPENIVIDNSYDNSFHGTHPKEITMAEYKKLDPASPKLLKVEFNNGSLVLSYYGKPTNDLRIVKSIVRVPLKKSEFVNYEANQEKIIKEENTLRISWKKVSLTYFLFSQFMVLLFCAVIIFVLYSSCQKKEDEQETCPELCCK